MSWQELFVSSSDKPRGMSAAKAKAEQIFLAGGGVKDCPYKSKSWRTAFVQELQKLQQTQLEFKPCQEA